MPASAWGIRNFRLYTSSSILNRYFAETQSLIVGWQVYELMHDPFYLGLVGLVEVIPALGLALFAGQIVDRSDPLVVYRNVSRLALAVALVLFLVSNPRHPFDRGVQLPVLYLAAFLAGTGRGFRMPSSTALVPQLVPRDSLQISSAWNTAMTSIASTAGPALGGLFYAWGGAVVPYGLNACLMLGSLALLAGIHYERHTLERPPEGSGEALEKLTAGFRYVFGHPLLFPALALDMFSVLFGGAVALLPVFAGEILRVGPMGLGILRASDSVGSMLGSLVLVRSTVTRRSGALLLACVAGFGMAMVGFGLSQRFWLSLACLTAGGFFDGISMVIRGTMVQLAAPPGMRGRVGAVNSVFISISNELGAFESGVAAKLLGTARSVVLGGMVTLVFVAGFAARSRDLREMELAKL